MYVNHQCLHATQSALTKENLLVIGLDNFERIRLQYKLSERVKLLMVATLQHI